MDTIIRNIINSLFYKSIQENKMRIAYNDYLISRHNYDESFSAINSKKFEDAKDEFIFASQSFAVTIKEDKILEFVLKLWKNL